MVIELLPTVLTLLSQYDMFLTERFEKEEERLQELKEGYKESVEEWLKEIADDYPKLKNNIPSTSQRLLDLVKLQRIAEDVRKSDDIDQIVNLFEDYCRYWQYISQTDTNYLLVTNNFDLENDYFKEWELKLFDYYSDLTLMGLMTIAYCSKADYDDDDEYFDVVKKSNAVLLETEKFLIKAKNNAENRETNREEHLEYIGKLQYLLEHEISAVSHSMGQETLRRGYSTYSAFMFKKAMTAEESLIKLEKEPEKRIYHEYNHDYFSSMIDFALGIAWLEKAKSGLVKTKNNLPSKSLWESLKDSIWSGAQPFTIKEVERKLDSEIGRIDAAAETLAVGIDELIDPNLSRPSLNEFSDELKMPKLNTTPTPLA